MRQFQKIIQYLAFAFAIFLVVTIIQYSAYFVDFIAPMLGLEHSSNSGKVEKIISLESNQISYLDIDLIAANIEIKQGEYFEAKTSNKNITCQQKGQKIKIKEKKKNVFANGSSEKITITIPDDLILDAVDIDAGAGKVAIDKIQAKTGNFDLGAGQFTVKDIYILEELKIDSGAGKVTISNGAIHNLDLEMGVGKADICCLLTGHSKIEAGIGELQLQLLEETNGYSFKVEKDIGSISYNGKDIDSSSFGYGTNFIDIEGGIGSIKIND